MAPSHQFVFHINYNLLINKVVFLKHPTYFTEQKKRAHLSCYVNPEMKCVEHSHLSRTLKAGGAVHLSRTRHSFPLKGLLLITQLDFYFLSTGLPL